MSNIIVIAYQLHYSRGSECAVAWDYISHMSRDNNLTVLYGSSGGHHEIGNTLAMEEYAAQHPMQNVSFIPIKPTSPSKYYGFSLIGIRRFYKEYQKWHDDVYHVVKDLISTNKYDIVHFLGPIGYHEPGRIFELPIPYVWGPVGGIVKVPASLLLWGDIKSGGTDGIKIILKAIISRYRLFASRRVKTAMRNSDVIVTATRGNNKIIRKAVGKNHHSIITYLPENCIKEIYELNYSKFESKRINLIFIGRLDAGKAPMIVLEALNRLGESKNAFHFDILGDGPLMKFAKDYVQKNCLDDIVVFHGSVERFQVFKMLSDSHLMLLPSLCDANTTVVWEAMSHAVPTMCLDHCGMHDTIKETSGIKIPVTKYDRVVSEIASQLTQMASNPTVLKEMAIHLLEDRKEYTWENRVRKFEGIYSLAQAQYFKREQ